MRKWKDRESRDSRDKIVAVGNRPCLMTSSNLKHDISNKIRIYDSNKLNSGI